MNKDQAIQKAIGTLAELCDDKENGSYDTPSSARRQAAEEILRHYREDALVDRLKHIEVTINGAVPVRPMTRSEVSA